MFKKSVALAGVTSLIFAGQALAESEKWAIDSAHSDAHFSIKHLMVSNVQGDFGKIKGEANYDGEHFNKASVEATIPVADISTREAKRDEHLKSPDFFDVAKYPNMTFKSKEISIKGDQFQMKGDLTLHGVTKEVTLTGKLPDKPIKDPFGKTRIGASATTTLNRKDFGISWNKNLDSGGVMLGEDVSVTIDVELVKAPNS